MTLTPPSGSTQTITTAASAYAPLTNLVSGTYTWTVTARDASGNADRIGQLRRSQVNNQLQATLQAGHRDP